MPSPATSSATGPAEAPATFLAALAAQQRLDGARPLVTFYDDATGERVELSVTTYGNWVAKTAGLVQDELDGERGGLVLVDLPTHWLGAVWLGAAWTLGMAVTDDGRLAGQADVLVCGPDRLAEYAAPGPGARQEHPPVVALSLRPLAGRFTEPLPAGVIDYGAVVLAQPDVLMALEEPTGTDVAWRDAAGTVTQAELLAEATASPTPAPGGRLLTDLTPSSRAGLGTLLAPLVVGGGTVWVRNPAPGSWSTRADQERVSDVLRATR
jgi:uncharacterized protein (TIGR03089 family)